MRFLEKLLVIINSDIFNEPCSSNLLKITIHTSKIVVKKHIQITLYLDTQVNNGFKEF